MARRHAQRSTGPRTPSGKRQVRWNTLQHGILARELLTVGQDRQEQKEPAGLLADRCIRELKRFEMQRKGQWPPRGAP